MMKYSRRQWLIVSTLAAWQCVPSVWAQQPRPRLKGGADRKIDTRVTVELITAEGAGQIAQDWAAIFQDLDVSFSVRRSLPKDKLETTETTSGISLRDVHAIGRLERDGTVTFADRRFTTADVGKIRDWVAGLKAYGAQGSPTGQPMWGLSKAQFEPLYDALSPALKTEPQTAALNKAIDLFTVRTRYPLRYTADATEHLERGGLKTSVERAYGGLSEGAALAGILNEFGLGFQPQRMPSGKLELAIVVLTPEAEVWPVGWPLDTDAPKVAPELFKSVNVDLDEEPLQDILLAVGDLVKVPVLIDEAGLARDRIDIKNVKISHKPKKTLWSAALKHICFQARCKWELRSDEAGHPLIWVMSAVPPKEEPKSKRLTRPPP